MPRFSRKPFVYNGFPVPGVCPSTGQVGQARSDAKRMNSHKLAAILGLILVVAFTGVAQQKRNITEKDIFDFQWVADPQISPDGSTVAFVKVTVNAQRT